MVLALLTVGCNNEPLPAVKPHGREVVSLNQLVSEPDRLDRALVRVTGICRVEFEGNALYPSKESFDKRDDSHALWLNLGWPVSKEILALDGQQVVVDAKFDASTRGHLGVFAGTLTDIQTIDLAVK
jgi:hypothetical protein